MKRLRLLILAMLLMGFALAEEVDLDAPVWMSANRMDDFYFHATERCRLATGEEQRRERVFAELMKKAPCPVCWPDETDYTGNDGVEGGPLECFERGGTLVLRISDYAIRARMFGASEPADCPRDLVFVADRRDDDLARLVHGEAYVNWAETATPGTEQSLTATIPDLDSERTDAVLMSRRHIGAAWVLVIRPGEADRAAIKKGGYYHLPMVFWEADLRVASYDAGVTITPGDGTRRWAGDVGLLPQKSAGEVVYSRSAEEGADYPIYVVRDGGVNTAVLRMPYYRESDLNGWLQYCGQTTRLKGYVDGKDVVYVCALTDGEVRALEETLAFNLYAPLAEEPGQVAEAAALEEGHEPVTTVTQPDGTVATMDQAAYPVGTGFVSFTLTRLEGGIAWYGNHIPLQRLENGHWRSLGTLEGYADGDPDRAHEGYFCDHVSLTLPLDKIGALTEGLYRIRVREDYGDDEGPRHSYLEFRVTGDAPAPAEPEKRVFGGEGLIVLPHTPPHADAATYNSCMDATRVCEGAARTRLLAGDTVFELIGVDESWGWGLISSYNLFAYPEGHPEDARQILANFDHGQATMYDLGDGLLLCGDDGGLWRCDYDGGNLVELGSVGQYPGDLLPVGDGLYIFRTSGVLFTSLSDIDPKTVYASMEGTAGVENDTHGDGYAVWAEGRLFIADGGIVALDASHPNADGTLPANWLTNDYASGDAWAGYGYIVLSGRLYCWSEQRRAMISMNLNGTDIQEVSKEHYWFHSVTPEGIVLALSGTEPGMFGDERTDAAFYFPPDLESPTFDPDHCEKHAIEPNSFDFVLGDYCYHRDEDGNETRQPLAELKTE